MLFSIEQDDTDYIRDWKISDWSVLKYSTSIQMRMIGSQLI